MAFSVKNLSLFRKQSFIGIEHLLESAMNVHLKSTHKMRTFDMLDEFFDGIEVFDVDHGSGAFRPVWIIIVHPRRAQINRDGT